MRRILSLVLFLLLFFILSSFSFVETDGLSVGAFPEDHRLKLTKVWQENSNLGRLFLFPEQSFNVEKVVQIVEQVSVLPPSTIQKLVDKNVKIKLFTGRLTDDPFAEHLKGSKPRGYTNKQTTWDDVPGMGGDRIVLVKIGASEPGNGHSSINLELHELAHTIDTYAYDGIRDDVVFLGIWEQEVSRLFPGKPYYSTYPEEYFAETYAMFFANSASNKVLKEKAPHTYLYIKQLN
ncbi:toxin [Peribacillus loiseleuriae]|uniref:anthrax toxin lethal factor-related metalloendopeptidase n=1 Tax=Peribacillus loiseleuriae TaxID=1679170 RepID=UPI003803DD02